MTVYLLHFERKLHHARHYLGYARDLDRRLQEHQAGQGARLMEVVVEAGIPWQLARTWDGGYGLEKH
jgi:predicted GIY-YIG superfamily endonuclease